MRILAFESSAKAASVAIMTDGLLTAEAYQNCGLTHSVTLLAMAQDLLQRTNLTMGDIDAYAVARGPGSFTGIRIGIAAVKGLGWGDEKPCIGVSTLEAMAEMHTSEDCLLCPVMDARRNQVYNALFQVENGHLQRLTPDRAIAMDELAGELARHDGRKILVGDGAQLCYNTIGRQVSQLQLMPEPFRHQRASGVALAAWRRVETNDWTNAEALMPNYLRLSQAERERMERMKNT